MLSQSRYKNLLPLFVSRNILLVSPDTKAKEMLRILKGVPQINLLGESPGLLRDAAGGGEVGYREQVLHQRVVGMDQAAQIMVPSSGSIWMAFLAM